MSAPDIARIEEECARHGATLLQQSPDGAMTARHVPITAQPLVFSGKVLQHAFRIMPLWNKLIDRAARDPAWLLEVLRGSDPEFTERLLDIMERVYVKDPAGSQRAMLGIFRSDYLLDAASAGSDGVVGGASEKTPLRHIEINTIACAFVGLSTRVGLVHQALQPDESRASVVVSDSEGSVAAALHQAHAWWCERHTPDAIVAIVVQKGERNSADQQLLIERLKVLGVAAARITLEELGAMGVDDAGTATVAGPDGKRAAISVFYHRALYDLRDFPDEAAWATREALERTNAIKCPSLPYHMCGCKRVQQAFTNRAVLQKFVTEEEADDLLSCMVPQFLLHDTSDATNAAIADAIANPAKYVIKTQEESTGRLFGGAQVVSMLSIPPTDPTYERVRHEHLLMQRIVGQRFEGSLVRDGVATHATLESEFGTFGTILSDGNTIFGNQAAGYLVRTKSADVEGGGVMSGVSALDAVAVVN